MPDPTEQTPPADWSWQDDPDVVSWDHRQGPDLDKLAEVLARHGVTLTEVDTGGDDVAVRVGSTPVEVMEDALCRRVWAAALRWAAHRAAEPFGQVQDGDLDSTDLRQMADQMEAGTLTPWEQTPSDRGGLPCQDPECGCCHPPGPDDDLAYWMEVVTAAVREVPPDISQPTLTEAVRELRRQRDDALQAAAAEADLADQMRRERDDARAEAARAGRETTGVREELTRMAGDLEDRDLEVRRLRRELRDAREAGHRTG